MTNRENKYTPSIDKRKLETPRRKPARLEGKVQNVGIKRTKKPKKNK